LEDLASGEALEDFHKLRRGEPRGSADEQMDVIPLDVLLEDLKAVRLRHARKEVFQKFFHLWGSDVLPVLRGPDEMI